MVRRTRPGISRFRVRCCASPRNDGVMQSMAILESTVATGRAAYNANRDGMLARTDRERGLEGKQRRQPGADRTHALAGRPPKGGVRGCQGSFPQARAVVAARAS